MQFARKTLPGSGASAPLPIFGGLRGSETTTSLVSIERLFTNVVAALQIHETSALDIKASTWGDAIATFRASVKDLENMLSGVIADSFAGVQAIGPAADLLEAFASLAVRPAVRAALNAAAAEVFNLFSSHVAMTKKAFEGSKSEPPISAGAAPLSAAAGWALGLCQRLTVSWKQLQGALVFLGPSTAADEAADAWQRLRGGLEEYAGAKNGEWALVISHLDAVRIQERLKVPLFSRATASDALEELKAESAASARAAAAELRVKTVGGATASSATNSNRGAGAGIFLKSNFDRLCKTTIFEAEGWEALGNKFCASPAPPPMREAALRDRHLIPPPLPPLPAC